MAHSQTHSTNIVGDGIDRIQSAFENAQTEIERVQSDLQSRRKKFEKRAEKEFKRISKQIRKNETVKRAVAFQQDLGAQVEAGLDSVLGNLQIASRRDLDKLDKKLNKISRKLTALDKVLTDRETPTNGVSASK